MESQGSQSWLENYLAPLGVLGPSGSDHQGAAIKNMAKRTSSMSVADQSSVQSRPRPAFNDITNNDIAMKPLLDKGKVMSGRSNSYTTTTTANHSASSQVQHSSRTQLPQQSFNDPSLIDGGQHADSYRSWVDVDANNLDDPQACAPYAQAIFQHLREAEKLRRANPAYLEEFQNDMNSKMRAILVDWLVEVAEEYKLCADTLYLTINYIDRFLSKHIVQRSQLQLVGVACMWVAAKYEEIYPPNVADFCYITDSTYSKEHMVMMEETVLKKLSYELAVPTAKTFLRRLLQVCNPDELLHFLSNYLTELSLLDHVMMRYLPSEVAAASVYLANLMLRRPGWDGNLQHYSTYTPQDILPCVRSLAVLHQAVSTHPQLSAIREKYNQEKFQFVSRVGISSALQRQLSLN